MDPPGRIRLRDEANSDALADGRNPLQDVTGSKFPASSDGV